MTTAFDRIPDRHRDRAAACRRLSEQAYTAALRDSYLHLAESYDGLAETEETLVRLELEPVPIERDRFEPPLLPKAGEGRGGGERSEVGFLLGAAQPSLRSPPP